MTVHILMINMNEGQEEGLPVMQPDLKGVSVALIGGDAREVILAERLADLGATVRVVALPVREQVNIKHCLDPVDGLEGVQAVILPIPGINDAGQVFTAFFDSPLILSEQHFKLLPKGTPVLAGIARPLLRKITALADLKLIEIMELDEVAILNSIPSAEGALQIAMANTAITIHGSNSLVLGFGRTGMTLARDLKALGAMVTVVARGSASRARAQEMGLDAVDFSALPDVVHGADIIFNTVPALVLDEKVLKCVARDALIVDIASSPGGTDFTEAEQLGIKAILAPGLPGKVAPKTAGNILARVVPGLLAEILKQ
jgi:dipicolinate synthase subunit A